MTALQTVTCGSWSALPVGAGRWEITCSRLPDFREVVACSGEVAGQLVVRLQSEYRTDLLEFAPV